MLSSYILTSNCVKLVVKVVSSLFQVCFKFVSSWFQVGFKLVSSYLDLRVISLRLAHYEMLP